MKEAMFWEKVEDGAVRCGLCYHRCVIRCGSRGLCEVRENRDGRLISLVYGHPAAKAVDPIEKKPLYHVLPGSRAYSIGTVGCNFRCLHCQNCSLSQAPADDDDRLPPWVPPETIVSQAKAHGCKSIAYTYNEPTIFFEYAYDIARLARDAGLKNLFVTNGYIMPEPLKTLAPVLDAANIDLKFFSDERYREVAGARLQPVLDTIRLYHALGIWIEITTLVIPGYNDDTTQLRGIAGFIAGIDPGIPWHVTAFHPAYRLLDARPTSVQELVKAEVIGREAGLKHVHIGNVRW
jgi:pyruvate formate lyase activating enzyme